MLKFKSKILAVIVVLMVVLVYGSQYYASIIGKKYFKKFIADQFEKVEYNIQLKFFERHNKNTYLFDIMIDKKNIALRPVIMGDKRKNSMGGFPFILDDSNFIFYNKILQMIKVH